MDQSKKTKILKKEIKDRLQNGEYYSTQNSDNTGKHLYFFLSESPKITVEPRMINYFLTFINAKHLGVTIKQIEEQKLPDNLIEDILEKTWYVIKENRLEDYFYHYNKEKF